MSYLGKNSELVGPANEGLVLVNGTLPQALIDTGSQRTTVAFSLYYKHPRATQMHRTDELLQVKGGGGETILY